VSIPLHSNLAAAVQPNVIRAEKLTICVYGGVTNVRTIEFYNSYLHVDGVMTQTPKQIDGQQQIWDTYKSFMSGPVVFNYRFQGKLTGTYNVVSQNTNMCILEFPMIPTKKMDRKPRIVSNVCCYIHVRVCSLFFFLFDIYVACLFQLILLLFVLVNI
jgi:hypothetical protein